MSSPSPVFFNPFADIKKTSNHLPHWQQPGATYFITFRMADSVPDSLRLPWEAHRGTWLALHPKPWTPAVEQEYHERFSGQVERWLDSGHGSCALREPDTRAIVSECLQHFNETRYVHHGWVVMPNHVHVLTSLHRDWDLERVIHTWKSFTSHRIPSHAAPAGTFWQEDYFDRLVRDARHFANCVRYIRRNPLKARLGARSFTLYESPLAVSCAPYER